uniref:Isoform 2 of Spermatogenesis-associated protein 8 n=1 Tax=Homo sapiens TaxID=9606 RepID=Q6RVD6-2|nr:SPATA8 protein [Homo sapiens]
MAPAGMSGAQDNSCLYQEIAPSFQRLPCPRYLMSCPWQFSTPDVGLTPIRLPFLCGKTGMKLQHS